MILAYAVHCLACAREIGEKGKTECVWNIREQSLIALPLIEVL